MPRILWAAVILLQRNSSQRCWHKASLQFPREILLSSVLLRAASEKNKDTTEETGEKDAVGTLLTRR